MPIMCLFIQPLAFTAKLAMLVMTRLVLVEQAMNPKPYQEPVTTAKPESN